MLLIRSTSEYLSFDVVTKIQIINVKPVLFPTITICNTDAFVTENASDYIKYVFRKNYGINLTEEFYNSFENVNMVGDAWFISHREAFKPEFGDERRKSMGFSLEEMYIDCNFNQFSCFMKDLSWFWDFNYGNCFKFNSGFNFSGDPIPLRYSSSSGIYGGLVLRLLVPNKTNKFTFSSLDGLLLVVHNNTDKPDFDNAVFLSLNTETSIGIKRTFIHKYPSPYSECQDTSSYDSYLFKKTLEANDKYTQVYCYKLCLEELIIENCNCHLLEYPVLYNNNLTACENQKNSDCWFNEISKFNNGEYNGYCSSQCPLECDSLEFDFSYSVSEFPSKEFYEKVKFYKESVKNLTYDDFKQRVLSISVYYPQLKYTEITEMPSTSLIDYLANIGGTVGLFLGISVLSLVEVVEILMEISFTLIDKYIKKERIKNIKI